MNKRRKELTLFQKCKEEILQTEVKFDKDIGMPTEGLHRVVKKDESSNVRSAVFSCGRRLWPYPLRPRIQPVFTYEEK